MNQPKPRKKFSLYGTGMKLRSVSHDKVFFGFFFRFLQNGLFRLFPFFQADAEPVVRINHRHGIGFWVPVLILLMIGNGCEPLNQTKPHPILTTTAHRLRQDDRQRSQIRSTLEEIKRKNKLLSEELGKLPELQGPAGPDTVRALKTIRRLYGKNPKGFNHVFSQIRRIGLPKVRRYCSLLQALFWLAEDNQIGLLKETLTDYTHEKLLCVTWPTRKLFRIRWPRGRIERLVRGCSETANRRIPYILHHSIDYADFYLLKEKRNPVSFEFETDEDINLFHKNKTIRWRDFDRIVDRLNAPELVDFYTRYNIDYDYYFGSKKTNKTVVRSQKANCADLTEFSVYCLNKAGYKARALTLSSKKQNSGDAHQVVKFYRKGLMFIMDNGRIDPQGIFGPVNTIEGARYWLNP